MSHPIAAESGFVPVANGQLYFESSGSGPDTVVLIHGNAGDRRHWTTQVPALAPHMKVIAYDVRGFGRSSVPVADAAYSDFDDLLALLDALRIDAAHIVGWSMGAGIATDFALAHGARTRSLVAVGPWINGHASEAVSTFIGELGVVARAFQSEGQNAALDAWMASPGFAASILDPAMGAEFRRIAADYSWWAMGNRSPQQPLSPGAADRLAEIAAPTLVLTAEADLPACLECADLLQASIAGAVKVVMPGTGHLLQMEAPEAFNGHLLNFLQSN
jgi:pimeloyl-ACP methyl ester carboxylesterase